MKMVRSALGTGRLYPQEIFLVPISRLSRSHGHSAAGRIFVQWLLGLSSAVNRPGRGTYHPPHAAPMLIMSSHTSNAPLALYSGPGSVVGIASGYGLDGPGIESRWGEIFRTCPDRPWGPPSLLYNGYQFFPGVKSGRGVTLTPHTPLGPRS
jgi:hypothetical protein